MSLSNLCRSRDNLASRNNLSLDGASNPSARWFGPLTTDDTEGAASLLSSSSSNLSPLANGTFLLAENFSNPSALSISDGALLVLVGFDNATILLGATSDLTAVRVFESPCAGFSQSVNKDCSLVNTSSSMGLALLAEAGLDCLAAILSLSILSELFPGASTGLLFRDFVSNELAFLLSVLVDSSDPFSEESAAVSSLSLVSLLPNALVFGFNLEDWSSPFAFEV